MLVFTVCELG